MAQQRGKKLREKEILDYHYSEVMSENEDQRKIKKKIAGEIKRKILKSMCFIACPNMQNKKIGIVTTESMQQMKI